MVNKFTQWSPIEEFSALFIQRPNPFLLKKKLNKKQNKNNTLSEQFHVSIQQNIYIDISEFR